VTLACESGVAYERGPEVRTQTILPRMSDGPASTIHEMHRFGGKVVDAEGEPLADVWITLPELGLFAASDPQGRFRLDRVPGGTHALVARSRDGREAKAEIAVPGAVLDLQMAAPKTAKKKGG
jgi:hypothetical protein